jgi:predicted AlkP superfamily phosphohydrolase/phosphomutase
MNKKKTIVIGLDGATWKLLKPFADKGYMPNMARLLKEGVHGNLKSTMPAMTAPAWTTFITGKNPGNHGIFDFLIPSGSLSNMKFTTSHDVTSKTLYEMLQKEGIKPILVNLPTSYPPRLEDEITVTSLLTQGDQWIFPESLKEEYDGFKKYRLTPDESLRLKERTEEYLDDLLVHLDEQADCMKWLFENKPWDFFFTMFSHTDWASHSMYTQLEEEHAESPRRVFERVDEHVGWFLDNAPEDANIVLISDHGFKAYKKIFYFNKWLEKEGYLKTNSDSDSFRSAATRRAKEQDKLRAQKKRINLGGGFFQALSRVPLAEKSAKLVYNKFVKKYMPVNVKVQVGVDYANSQVCFPKGSYITNAYINKDWVYDDGTVSREEYLPLRNELVEKMRAIRDPEGNPVVARVLTRDEVYGDGAPENAPDIFFELADYWLVGQFHSGKLFGEEEQNKHDQYGIFVATGPDFASGKEVDGLDMEDMTPLLLHLNGLGVPSDCDGQVNTAVFAKDSESAKRTVATAEPSAPAAPKEKAAIAGALGKIKL